MDKSLNSQSLKVTFGKKLKTLSLLCAATFAGFSIAPNAYAEDIELYVKNKVSTNEKPRVLLVFDTSGSMNWRLSDGRSCGQDYNNNWIECTDSRLKTAKAAVNTLIDNSPDVTFGLMRFNGSSGGYVLSGLGTAHSTIKSQIAAIDAQGVTPLSETTYEGYLYLSGKNMQYGDNVSSNKRDTSVDNGYRYESPFKPEKNPDGTTVLRCDNTINVILITDGDPTSDRGVNDDIYKLFGDDNKPKPIATYEGYDNYLHSLAEYMANNDLYSSTSTIEETARTYTIGFGSGMSEQGKYLLKETAKLGKGTYFHANNAADLAAALEKTIQKIREVNDTFTSPSVASSQSDRTKSLDSVYYAMFYPKGSARWQGNIKKLKLKGDILVDKDEMAAIDSDGNIVENAKTYWLKGDVPDGNVVAKGGVSEHLAAMTKERTVYTDVGAGTPMPIFNLSNAKAGAGGSEAALATHMDVDKDKLADYINWSKGKDLDKSTESKYVMREDVLGDPLHSKPIALNYGDGNVYILVGTNAGYIHMFKDSGDSVEEVWSFIPYELYPIIKDLKENTKDIKVYGMDLTPAVHFDDANGNGVVDSGDKVWAFFGMRRGGGSYYALDISIQNAPSLLWSKPINEDRLGYSELAQSWSIPKITYINVKGYADKPLLVFGAGYDTNKDNVARSSDTKGRGLFIADAETGNLVWSLTPAATGGSNTNFPGDHGITGGIALLDSDYDGYTDRLYAADVGGDIWRVDMPSDTPIGGDEPWSVFKLAALGGDGASDRRFFYEPEVARTYFSKVTIDNSGSSQVVQRQMTPYEAVVIGSGNRAKPSEIEVANNLYMIRDENVITKTFKDNAKPNAITHSELMNMDPNVFGDVLDNRSAFTQKEAELARFKGWKYGLGVGEKSLSKATIIGGVAYFSTFTPSDETAENACSLSGGMGALYAFHLHYGVKVYNNHKMNVGDRIPATPQMVFNSNADGESQFLLVGVGKGDNSGVIKAKSIDENAVPRDKDGDGVLDLVGEFAGFKTHRSYIYKDTQNKVH